MLKMNLLKILGTWLIFLSQLLQVSGLSLVQNTSNDSTSLLPITDAPTARTLTYALLSQRTIALEQIYTDIPAILINISSIFMPDYNSNSSIAELALSNILAGGVDGFLIDLEYDTTNKTWRIYNQNSVITFELVLSAINSFVFTKSASIAKLRFFQILLNVVNKDDITIDGEILSQLENDILNVIAETKIFTQSNLKSYTGWPTLEQLLFYLYTQVSFQFVNVATNTSNNIFGSGYLNFINAETQNYTCPLVNKANRDIITYGNFYNPTLNTFNGAIYCGYKVIISSSYEKLNETLQLLNVSLVWGWGLNQPTSVDLSYGEYNGFSGSYGGSSLYGCANLNISQSTTYDGDNDVNVNENLWWTVANCYDSKLCLCKNPDINDSWAISTTPSNFFSLRSDSESNSVDHGCPENTYFTVPKSPIELLSLYNYLETLKNDTLINIIEENGVWIELNSVSLSSCWVVGDYRTTCPYAQFVNTRNFVKMVTPLVVTGGCLLIVGFLLKLKKLPVQNENRQWKRYTKEFGLKSDPDGVPY